MGWRVELDHLAAADEGEGRKREGGISFHVRWRVRCGGGSTTAHQLGGLQECLSRTPLDPTISHSSGVCASMVQVIEASCLSPYTADIDTALSAPEAVKVPATAAGEQGGEQVTFSSDIRCEAGH